jgi:stalled ribosome rescue protein Dom34
LANGGASIREPSIARATIGASAGDRRYVAVWLDHEEAHVLRIDRETFDESTLRAPTHHVKRHPDRNAAERNHPDDAKRFFHDVARALDSASEVLVVGPSTAKLHFLKYVHAHEPKLEQRIVGIETVDHPTDAQLAAFARHYFHGVDRMRGLTP